MNTVLAWCTHVTEGYGFFHVAFVKNADGSFVSVSDPDFSYPNRGTIFVGADIVGSSFQQGTFGAFEIEESPTYDPKIPRSAKYKAWRATPISDVWQVVSMSVNSKRTSEIAARLREGIEILGETGGRSHILLRLVDGVTCGPFEMHSIPNGHLGVATCDASSLNAVKSGWHDLPTIEVPVRDARYRFQIGPLPAAELHVDCAPLDYVLRNALETLVRLKQIQGYISLRKSRELSALLSGLPIVEELKPRVARLIASVDAIAPASVEMERLLSELLEQPAIKSQIESEIAKAKKEAVDKHLLEQSAIVAKTNAARKQFATLAADEANVQARIESAKEQLAAVRAETLAAGENLAHAVAAEVAKAEANATELLAKIAVLRPLLAGRPALNISQSSGAIVPRVTFVSQKTETLTDFREAFHVLTSNLQAAGLRKASAREVATTTLAAFLGNAAVSVRGSMGDVLAQAIASALFGDFWARIEVPIGCLDPIQIDWGEHSRRPNCVLFVSANRSCPDVYAADVLAGCRAGSATASIRPLLQLSEAPSALSPSALFSEIGPVIHADALLWDPSASGTQKHGSMALAFTPDALSFGDERTMVASAMAAFPNSSLSLHIARQAPLLASIAKLVAPVALPEDKAADEVLRVLTTWWILPYVAAKGGRRDHISELVEHFREDVLLQNHCRILFADAGEL